MSEEDLHRAMIARDASLGAGTGAGLATLGTHVLGRNLWPHQKGAIAAAGGLAGGLLGLGVGRERALKDKTKQERHVEDRNQSQEHRKELIAMRSKASSFDGVMLAAMTDELHHIHQEKVAINVASVGNFLGNVGSRALSGAARIGEAAAPMVSRAATAAGARSPALGSALGAAGKALGNSSGHLMSAAGSVGGGKMMGQLAGGALLGGTALGAGGFMAGRATAPRR